MYEVSIKLERHDGNDPLEAKRLLPFVPRKGDTLEAWVAGRPFQGPGFLEVEAVVLPLYDAPKEVWVRLDGYDMAEAERIFAAIEAGEQP